MRGRLLHNSTKIVGIIFLLVSLVASSGCSTSSSKKREVQESMDAIKSKPLPPIDPIPEFPETELHRYKADGMRSPFSVPETTKRASIGKPDENRAKQELESYPLDALKMVGTLHKGNQDWALITAPNGTIYRVTLGNFLGKNYGKIVGIKKDEIRLIETVPDGLGGWKKKEETVPLHQGEK